MQDDTDNNCLKACLPHTSWGKGAWGGECCTDFASACVFFLKAKILNITKQFNTIGLHENAIAVELCNLSGQHLKGNWDCGD